MVSLVARLAALISGPADVIMDRKIVFLHFQNFQAQSKKRTSQQQAEDFQSLVSREKSCVQRTGTQV